MHVEEVEGDRLICFVFARLHVCSHMLMGSQDLIISVQISPQIVKICIMVSFFSSLSHTWHAHVHKPIA